MALKVREILPEDVPVIHLKKNFTLSQEDLWQWLTDSAKTSLWIGSWQKTDQGYSIRLLGDDSNTDRPFDVEEINAPQGFTLAWPAGETTWRILLSLKEFPQGSQLELIQAWQDEASKADVAAGWQYYLDCLEAAVEGKALPNYEGPGA